MKRQTGFTMIELMVVVIIVGVLAAIAIPIYAKYVKNARVTEATGRLGDMLTASKAYSSEWESNDDPSDADWPANCQAEGFLGDCSDSENFSYTVTGARNGDLLLKAVGKAKMVGVVVTMKVTDPRDNGTIKVTGID